MTNDEAKALYDQSVALMGAGDHAGALEILDTLDRERPNSRHVNFHRALCLAGIGNVDEAEKCLFRLEGKIDEASAARVREAITAARAAQRPAAPAGDPFGDDEGDAGARKSDPGAVNLLTIQTVFPVSMEECSITGHVRSGVFHPGDELVVVTPGGGSITAPILRIGTAEMPLQMVRAGQKVSMLLKADPAAVLPGASATCTAHEEYYGATMVVSSEAPAAAATSRMTPELVNIEKMMKRGEYGDAERLLNMHLLQHPGHYAAHRIIAQLYLDAPAPFGSAERAARHIQSAYEKGGSSDPMVIHLLAEALGRTGKPDQGLSFLERLYSATREPDGRNALAQRVYDYRNRFKLGHVWQFADATGEVMYESSDPAELVKAVAREVVPRDARCRRDRVGEWQSIPLLLGPEFPEIAKLYGGAAPAGGKNYVLPALIAALAVALVAALINLMR